MTAVGADPRAATPPSSDIRPVVAKARPPLPGWLLIGFAALAAIALFIVLESRRQSLSAPATRPRASDLARLPTAPPPLFIPPETRSSDLLPAIPAASPPLAISTAPPARVPAPSPQMPSPVSAPPSPLQYAPPPTPVQRGGFAGPALVIDTTSGARDGGAGPAAEAPASAGDGATPTSGAGRVRAGQFVNRATTVPQGTLIPAVLETALDSTRPGQVRALVSRDVRGFDGSQILIPRGSRLFGDYRADLQPGQNRAFVLWTRLVRPDGVTIAIGSPAADPLGRAGIRGKVDSHFLERFGSAILQSALDIGVGVATQRLGGSTVVIVPGAFRSSTQAVVPTRQVQPTLTVKQGARVTVFVARDLDFTSAVARAE